jgi:putative alpha-1,2-mannosidase
LFKKITLTLDNGKKIVINADNQDPQNRYVQSLKINGKDYAKNYIVHSSLQNGATFDFKMSATPNKNRGTRPADFPYSFSTESNK